MATMFFENTSRYASFAGGDGGVDLLFDTREGTKRAFDKRKYRTLRKTLHD